MKIKFRFNKFFAIATVVWLVIEVLIALFVSGFVRNYVGDVLVVILMYTFIRTFWNGAKEVLSLYLFLFAVVIEIAQWGRLTDILSIDNRSALGVVIGSSFDWGDILSYAIGAGICYLVETLNDRTK